MGRHEFTVEGETFVLNDTPEGVRLEAGVHNARTTGYRWPTHPPAMEIMRLAKIEFEYEIFVAELVGVLGLDRGGIDREKMMPGDVILRELRGLTERLEFLYRDNRELFVAAAEAVADGVRAERERIKGEILEWLPLAMTDMSPSRDERGEFAVTAADLRAELDRICSEEGQGNGRAEESREVLLDRARIRGALLAGLAARTFQQSVSGFLDGLARDIHRICPSSGEPWEAEAERSAFETEKKLVERARVAP